MKNIKLLSTNHFLKPIKNELVELYSTATQKIYKRLDIVKILNDITYLKLITKFYCKPTFEANFAIRHCAKSVLDLDKILNSDSEQKPNKIMRGPSDF